MNASNSNRRCFPRAHENIRVQLSIKEGAHEFSAWVYSIDISLTGIFFASEFFLKAGTELDLTFSMPNEDRLVHVRGMVVREVRVDDRVPGRKTQSGFAVRFTEYYADAKTVLASSFLFAEMDEFISDFLARRTKQPSSEEEGLREVIIAWEVGKMNLEQGEFELVQERLKIGSDGKIRRVQPVTQKRKR
jgi:hypothetical protein